MQNVENKRFLNITEAAEYVGVGRSTIEYWISIGLKCVDLPSRGNGRKRFRRIERTELDCFLDSHCACQRHESKNKTPIYDNDEITLLPREESQGHGGLQNE